MKPFVIAKNADMTTAIRVEYFSTGWMAFEFLIGFWSGFQAGSILLIAFGLDSFLEIISGATLIWRLKKKVTVQVLRLSPVQNNAQVL